MNLFVTHSLYSFQYKIRAVSHENFDKHHTRNNNNNIPNEIPLSGIWGGQSVHKPYHHLVEVERLSPKAPRLKCINPK